MIYAPIQLADDADDAPACTPVAQTACPEAGDTCHDNKCISKCVIDGSAIKGMDDFSGAFKLIFNQATKSDTDCSKPAKWAMGIIATCVIVAVVSIVCAIVGCIFVTAKKKRGPAVIELAQRTAS